MSRSVHSPEHHKRKRDQSRVRYDDRDRASLQERPTTAMRRRHLAAYSLRVPLNSLDDALVARLFAHLPTLRTALQNANRVDASHTYLEYLDAYFLAHQAIPTAELGEQFGVAPTTVSGMLQRIYHLIHEALLTLDPGLIREAQSSIAATDAAFWDRVEKAPEPDGCWMWKGATDLGYGVVKRQGKKRQAHRYAYELAVGPLTEGLHLFHTCRVRNCVNPAHLYEAAPGDIFE